MSSLNYAAASLGGRELTADPASLEALRNAAFPLLAANLPARERRKWGAEPYVILELPAFKVGVLGMAGTLETDFRPGLDPRLPEGAPPTEDYRQTLTRHVEKLKKRCSMLIVLTQADMGKAVQILRELPEIDVLVSSKEALLGREPIEVGRSIVLFAGTEGRRVGHLRLRVYADGSVGMIWGQSLLLKESMAENPEAREFVRETTARANAWHRARAETTLAAGTPAPGESAFLTAATCENCHAETYAIWQRYGHAHAMAVLVENDEHFLPQCVSCHVTGMGAEGGFRDLLSTPELADVQCEACHGPARKHLADLTAPYGAVGLESCARTCHTPDQTGGAFDAEREWSTIRH